MKGNLLSKGQHSVEVTGGQLEYFVHTDIEDNAVVPVFFHAALDRQKIKLPRFEGINLCSKYGITGISIADPVLNMYDKCSLSWFIGNDRYQLLQKEIHEFLEKISIEKNLTFIFHGGSGGGFAALVQKKLFGNKHFAIVQNPQTDIFYFTKAHLDNYFLTYDNRPIDEKEYCNVLKEYKLIWQVDSKEIENIVYFQNKTDELHVNKHLKPFLNRDYEVRNQFITQKRNNNYYFIGEWGNGHAVIPNEVLQGIIKRIIEKRTLKKIDRYVKQFNELYLLRKKDIRQVLK